MDERRFAWQRPHKNAHSNHHWTKDDAMAFETEIKLAQKVADEWLERSKRDEAYFIGMKKNGVKWEKDNVVLIEKHVNDGEVQEALEAIKTSRTWLADYTHDCEEVFKKHGDFIRGAPRAGSAGICEKIGLKDKKAAVYEAVNKAMTKALLVHTSQFKATEAAWTNDLKPRINLLTSKLDTLEKLAKGESGNMDAYGKQFAKDSVAYLDQMKTALISLKPTMAEKAIKDITSDPGKWCAGDVKSQTDQYKIFNERVSLIENLLLLSEKNYGRVLKSIPDEVKSKLMFARSLNTFKIKHMEILKDLKVAQGTFKTAVAVVAKNYPKII